MRSSRSRLTRGAGFAQVREFTKSSISFASNCRSILSEIWIPTGGLSATENETGHEKLVRAGFLRQSQAGVFQLLPLGFRIQRKIEALLDYRMRAIGASRLSLSALTTEELWQKSARLSAVKNELFRFQDRKDTPLMLSPTHEEEITSLVAGTVKSYKDLPLRLYQIASKYRDEMRPRHGLLRSRDFVMKDLYTFDRTLDAASKTYCEVSDAYKAFFNDLQLPIRVAKASSGDMGGDYSHEYHLLSPIGKDDVMSCNSCGYTTSHEVAVPLSVSIDGDFEREAIAPANFRLWQGITRDRKTLVNAWYPCRRKGSTRNAINVQAVNNLVSQLDESIRDPKQIMELLKHENANTTKELHVLNLCDYRLASNFEKFRHESGAVPSQLRDLEPRQTHVVRTASGKGLNLLGVGDGDLCPQCRAPSLRVQRALELGHTFLLGTRYTQPLGLSIALPHAPKEPVPVQMGCYGIGVSRILGAVAEHKADDRGLNWPPPIAPFEVIIIPTSEATSDALHLYDTLVEPDPSSGARLDIVLDDRRESFGWKMKDADLIGYPIIVILGKAWREERVCEVQCRSLGSRKNVAADTVLTFVRGILARL